MSENTDLPPLSMWQARSTWIVLVAAAAQIAAFARFDLFGLFGVEGQEPLIDGIMQIVAAAALVWTWIERRAPNYRLTAKAEAPTHPDAG